MITNPLKDFLRPKYVVGLQVKDGFIGAVQIYVGLKGPEIETLLPARAGTFRSVLMTYQSGLAKTIEELKSAPSGTVQTLGDILRTAVLETDGISIDRFKARLAALYEQYFSHWDSRHNAPEKGKGIENPYLKEVGEILRRSGVPVIEFRASIVIGSSSLSFEMVRALVERLPVMITPRWVDVRAQPIAIGDVLQYLRAALDVPADGNPIYEIGGPDRVSYGQLIESFLETIHAAFERKNSRKAKRKIIW